MTTALETQLPADSMTAVPAMEMSADDDLQAQNDFFWMMLSGGYIGTVICLHPEHGQAQLTIQQFIELNSFGLAFYQPNTSNVLQAVIGTQDEMVAHLQPIQFQGSWTFFPGSNQFVSGESEIV